MAEVPDGGNVLGRVNRALERRRTGDPDPATIGGIVELEPGRVQHEPRAARGGLRLRTVEDIADDRMAHECAVNAQLVRATRLGFEAKPGAIGLNREQAPSCERWATLLMVYDLVRAAVDIQPHGRIDDAGLGARRSKDQRDVGLGDGTVFELARQPALGLGVEPQHHQAGRIHVEPVDDERTRLHARPGDGGADAGCDTVLLALALAGHAEHARRLVDDDPSPRVVRGDDPQAVAEVGGPVVRRLWHGGAQGRPGLKLRRAGSDSTLSPLDGRWKRARGAARAT